MAGDDFTQCLVANARKAARAVTQRYDAYLRPHGLTATQFSLLGTISQAGGGTVSELAQLGGFDRTTLTRNLDRLESMGLVGSRHADKGNGRIGTLTPKGIELIEKLVPLWRKAQAELRAELQNPDFHQTLLTLKNLAKF
jgi:DNA-binding MarR family transcriptional regulator